MVVGHDDPGPAHHGTASPDGKGIVALSSVPGETVVFRARTPFTNRSRSRMLEMPSPVLVANVSGSMPIPKSRTFRQMLDPSPFRLTTARDDALCLTMFESVSCRTRYTHTAMSGGSAPGTSCSLNAIATP